MDRKAIELMGWRFRRLVRGLPWPMVAALGLAACDAAFYFSTVAPLQEQRAQLRAEASALVAGLEAPAAPQAHSSNPEADLADFYAALARPENAPELLGRLHRAAQAQGLKLEQAEYRPVPDPGGKLTRYQIVLPARGTYPGMRRFLAQAGREVPGLSLDGISFQRQNIGDQFLEAQIRFTLFLAVLS